jgi:hypothetical protein
MMGDEEQTRRKGKKEEIPFAAVLELDLSER